MKTLNKRFVGGTPCLSVVDFSDCEDSRARSIHKSFTSSASFWESRKNGPHDTEVERRDNNNRIRASKELCAAVRSLVLRDYGIGSTLLEK
ncbi:hypothetical protein Tco_0912031, partial [Tanacetum coccineum]